MRRLYKNLRQRLDDRRKGQLSKLIFVLTNKPIVKKDFIEDSKKFPNSEKGGLIISADFEMAWAWRYTKTGVDHLEKGKIERENLPKIICALEKYNIPVTFATVGHLFLKTCKKGNHDWMTKIPYFDDHWKFNNGTWFDHDPYSNFKDAPEWYAPDLIQMIIESKIDHEIGTHTFSHIDFSDRNCPADVARDEIIACINVARPYGINLKSIVFPGGTWGNIEILKEYGIKIYRKNEDYDLTYPYRDKYGLLVTATSGPIEFNLSYGWSTDYYVARLKKYIDKAIETNTITHFWFHPSLNPVFIHEVFPEVLEYADRLRNKGLLWIGTMGSIADHINNNKIL